MLAMAKAIGLHARRKLTITDRPPVKPVEGHYALLRNGGVVMPSEIVAYGTVNWNEDGSWDDSKYHENDIIATISPADMQAAASGEIERLRAALDQIEAVCFSRWCGDLTTEQSLDSIVKILEALTAGEK